MMLGRWSVFGLLCICYSLSIAQQKDESRTSYDDLKRDVAQLRAQLDSLKNAPLSGAALGQ